MNWWSMSKEQTAKALETDLQNGLLTEEAKRRLAEYGENVLQQEQKKQSIVMRFLAQFHDFMILLLLGAAGVSVLVSRKLMGKLMF